MKNIRDIASDLRDRIAGFTHSNEKHVDDFSSDSDISIFGEEREVEMTKGDSLPVKIKGKGKEVENTQGIDPIVKTYYEGPGSGNGVYQWVEIPPRQMSKRVAAKLDRIGFKVYKIKDTSKPVINGKFQLKYHTLELQNPHLIAALKPILKKEGVYLHENEQATFNEPFRPLYFCADEIAALHAATPDGTPLKQQILLLLKVMGEIFGGTRSHVRELKANGLISYKLAWIYFRKDMIVYHPGKDTDRIFQVVDAKYEHKPSPHLSLSCKEVVFDGTGYVYEKVDLGLSRFGGNMPISKLPVYPIEFHPDPEGIKARLAERGRRVLDYQGLEYCMYKGVGYHENNGKVSKHNVDGRILIDTFGYQKHHETLTKSGGQGNFDPDYPRIDGLDGKPDDDKSMSSAETEVDTEVALVKPGQVKIEEDGTTKLKDSSYIKRLGTKAINRNKEIMKARSNDLMFVSPMLKGYCLKTKAWLQFYIDDVRPMEWNEEAYSHLVYPEEQKDLVLSFVEHHKSTLQNPDDNFDDVIKGKGNGLILLLSGPPGTGKTLTAEAVADKTHRPLLYMHAEDLGINPATLGARLKNMFEMATEWNAVCLLDECDVFLSARNPVDIARNELVSIFLREIEYFQGILFLTTNLYDSIDTAFRSRMSIHLRFNPLAPEARTLLWQKFLGRLPEMVKYESKKKAFEDGDDEEVVKMFKPLDNISDEDMKELALWELNGREIKSVIKTVKCWCEVKKFDITLARLEAGIKVTAPNSSKRGTVDTSLYDD